MGRTRMPRQKPGESKQDYETPKDFLDAVARMFGPLEVDLAAREDNAKAPSFVTPEQDSLSVDWTMRFSRRLCWLNPPFGRISPWMRKCWLAGAAGTRIIALTPASVGANWHRDYVHEKAAVLFLNGRITFVGCDAGFPKDCMLSLFGFGHTGYDIWSWRDT